MKSILIYLIILKFTFALPNEPHPLSDRAIAEINSKQSTWTAGRNFEVEEYELFKRLASGVKKPQGNLKELVRRIHDENVNIPESFDAREVWPECADIIGMIRDQSNCGACWAFASVEVMSDRICIHSNATKKLIISAQDVLGCADTTTNGCHGGWPPSAFMYWTTGVVTGGLYNHPEQGCESYFLASCGDNPYKCPTIDIKPICKKQCDDPSLVFDEQKTYGLDGYQVSEEKQIQLEILKNGPVGATMYVYEDFANYKGGIYQRTTNNYVGGHAVKIIGWGVENGIKYWLVVNSFNERWGENGYFRIIRGQNEVHFEEMITAAMPDFSRF